MSDEKISIEGLAPPAVDAEATMKKTTVTLGLTIMKKLFEVKAQVEGASGAPVNMSHLARVLVREALEARGMEIPADVSELG